MELKKKDAINNEMQLIDDMMAFKKKRYAMLVSKHANKYKWAAELYKQRKHKEKSNGRTA